IPTNNPAPCVPAFTGDNGGDIAVPTVTRDTIRIGYYSPKPDPATDAILEGAGAYDPPSETDQDYKDYNEIYSKLYETYGRKVQLVRIQGTGKADDATAATNDARTAAEQQHVFAVMGGPAQTRAFAETLAKEKVLCLGTCEIAAPEKFTRDR